MLDVDTGLDGRLNPKFLRFIYFLFKISFIELSFLFPNEILNLMLNFFVIFFINVKLSFFKL